VRRRFRPAHPTRPARRRRHPQGAFTRTQARLDRRGSASVLGEILCGADEEFCRCRRVIVYRICRIQCVVSAHAYAPISMFTRSLDGRWRPHEGRHSGAVHPLWGPRDRRILRAPAVITAGPQVIVMGAFRVGQSCSGIDVRYDRRSAATRRSSPLRIDLPGGFQVVRSLRRLVLLDWDASDP
jgi:hypothetical protein